MVVLSDWVVRRATARIAVHSGERWVDSPNWCSCSD